MIVTSKHGDYSCATYTGSGAKFAITTSWLPTAVLQAGAPGAGNASWTGQWKAGNDREIRLTPAGNGAVKIEATSTYALRMTAQSDDTPVPNLAVTVKPEGATIAFSLKTDTGKIGAFDADPASDDSDLCRARLWHLDPYLVISDNSNCFPGNGTARGVYRQVK